MGGYRGGGYRGQSGRLWLRRLLVLALLLGGFAGAAQANHGGPAWEHDDPARRVYGGGP